MYTATEVRRKKKHARRLRRLTLEPLEGRLMLTGWGDDFDSPPLHSDYTVVNPTGEPMRSLTETPGTLQMDIPERDRRFFFDGYDLATQVNFEALRLYRPITDATEPYTVETSFTTTTATQGGFTYITGLYLFSDDGNLDNDLVYGANINSLKIDGGDGSSDFSEWQSIGSYDGGLDLQVIYDGAGGYDFNYRLTGSDSWLDHDTLDWQTFTHVGLITKTWKLDGNENVSPQVTANFDFLEFAVEIVEPQQDPDFGDAPDTYGTTLASNGARHTFAGPFLGTLRDSEADAAAPLDGTGDDVTGDDDEDGVFFPNPLVAGTTTFVSVSMEGGGQLDYFFDFDGDDTFGNSADEVFNATLAGGTESVPVTIPAGAQIGSTFARFRISTDGIASAVGLAADGEVEDYVVEIVEPSQPPVITSVGTDATFENKSLPFETVMLTATFDDTAGDTHTSSIDWGDGMVMDGVVDQDADTVTGTHKYTTGGIYTVTVTVTDDDGNTTTATTTAVVTGVRLADGELQIVGTNEKDNVRVYKHGSWIKVRTKLDGGPTQHFAFDKNSINSILVFACEGNDHIHISHRIDVPATIDAGAGRDHVMGGRGDDLIRGGVGNDRIWAGWGDDIVLGDAGNDRIVGGFGRDILIGGVGRDRIFGMFGGDIVIGGTTDHDDDNAALMAILDEWTSGNPFVDRVSNIRNGDGLNDSYKFDADTVHADNERDYLFGVLGQDWLWAETKDRTRTGFNDLVDIDDT